MTDVVKITGATRLYAIVGDPIEQVRSPEVFTPRFAASGMNAVLVPVHVPTGMFDKVMPALMAVPNLDGLLVTVPFKARALPFASVLGTSARVIGAVNALRRDAHGSWTGDMFDGVGFVRAAQHKGARLAGRSVLLFGAGGAGSAIACALADAGVKSITISDLDAGRAQALIERLHLAFPDCELRRGTTRQGIDMIVNASPVGMRADDAMPGDIGALDPGTLIGDVVISASPTALIKRALAHGCTCVTGQEMHAGQVDAIMTFFNAGVTPTA
ncbi:MAG: shikimate dehydrogenase [Pseudomonadota bacterium]|nr:shikimate dehydrogenase [Pseudomonadota bacterium]